MPFTNGIDKLYADRDTSSIKLKLEKIMTVALVVLLAFTGCKKEAVDISKETDSLSDFTDMRASQVGVAYKNEIRLSNLKAIIRKIENTDNKYRLTLKNRFCLCRSRKKC